MDRPDPAEGVKRLVEKWNVDVICTPTWEELLEVEYVRRYGNINMFTGDVEEKCRQLGLNNAIAWFQRIKRYSAQASTVFSKAVKAYERDHGTQDSWLTKDVIKRFMSLKV